MSEGPGSGLPLHEVHAGASWVGGGGVSLNSMCFLPLLEKTGNSSLRTQCMSPVRDHVSLQAVDQVT